MYLFCCQLSEKLPFTRPLFRNLKRIITSQYSNLNMVYNLVIHKRLTELIRTACCCTTVTSRIMQLSSWGHTGNRYQGCTVQYTGIMLYNYDLFTAMTTCFENAHQVQGIHFETYTSFNCL